MFLELTSHWLKHGSKELGYLAARKAGRCSLILGDHVPSTIWGLEANCFPRAAITKHHQLGGLKQQRFILSKFKKPNDSFWKLWERSHPMPLPWLLVAAGGCWWLGVLGTPISDTIATWPLYLWIQIFFSFLLWIPIFLTWGHCSISE